jgi:hypothetical protein
MDMYRWCPDAGLRRAAALSLLLVMVLPTALSATAAAPAGGDGRPATDSQPSAPETPPDAAWLEVDSLARQIEVPPGEARVLRVNATSDRLEPVDWPGELDGLGASAVAAVGSVEPWLRHDLAANLRRLGGDQDRFAREVTDSPEARWRDEIAFAVAHTPPEVLSGVQTGILTENAREIGRASCRERVYENV